MIVNLQIDRLVLDGLPVGSHQGPLIQAAVEAEVARLLKQGWMDQAVPPGRVGKAPIESGSGPESLGTTIGQAVFADLQRHLEPHLTVLKPTAGQRSPGPSAPQMSREIL
jgi:hypothetical protein